MSLFNKVQCGPVKIPVKVFPTTESAATLFFDQLHAECQTGN